MSGFSFSIRILAIKESRAKVSLRSVAENGNDDRFFWQFFCNFHRGRNVGSRGRANQKAELLV